MRDQIAEVERELKSQGAPVKLNKNERQLQREIQKLDRQLEKEKKELARKQKIKIDKAVSKIDDESKLLREIAKLEGLETRYLS